MKNDLILFLSLVVFTLPVLLQGAVIPKSLRGGIDVKHSIIQTALAMQTQGWEYVMPQPKSPQSAWDNTDKRTSWWVGYWYNNKTDTYSSTTPQLKEGKYVGDEIDARGWKTGGRPRKPTKIEWLLSKVGGIKP
jgi:hypothetical protein